MDGRHKEKATRRPALPKPRQVYVAVHRYNNDLYYKRLTPQQYALLVALRDGATLEAACDAALARDGDESLAGEISVWFKTWMELGWFRKWS